MMVVTVLLLLFVQVLVLYMRVQYSMFRCCILHCMCMIFCYYGYGEYVFLMIILVCLFLLKYGSLGENIFRGVWNKAQALVYVVFSVRVLLILM